MVTSGNTSCFVSFIQACDCGGEAMVGFYDFVPADVIIAQLIVMIPQRLKELQ